MACRTSNIDLGNELKIRLGIYNGFRVELSEELVLISFLLKDTMGKFLVLIMPFSLLRTEEVYKFMILKKGRGFQPDFLLF
jgi:hypothetical protein